MLADYDLMNKSNSSMSYKQCNSHIQLANSPSYNPRALKGTRTQTRVYIYIFRYSLSEHVTFIEGYPQRHK